MHGSRFLWNTKWSTSPWLRSWSLRSSYVTDLSSIGAEARLMYFEFMRPSGRQNTISLCMRPCPLLVGGRCPHQKVVLDKPAAQFYSHFKNSNSITRHAMGGRTGAFFARKHGKQLQKLNCGNRTSLDKLDRIGIEIRDATTTCFFAIEDGKGWYSV